MFSHCRPTQTSRYAQRVIFAGCAAVIALSLAAGCSKQFAPPTETDWSLDPGKTVRAEVQAGGVNATYTAYLDGTHITRINEVRRPAGSGGSATGDYEFNGARLVAYRGTALLDQQRIELTFDMNGALTTAHGASDAEVSAIRNRASLLRSLALTKFSTQSHGG